MSSGGVFWLYLVLVKMVTVWGSMIFTVLIMEGYDFYCVNDCIMFGAKFGSTSPPWNQPVFSAGLLSIPSPHPKGTA